VATQNKGLLVSLATALDYYSGKRQYQKENEIYFCLMV
jgi:hypothetical protein